MSNQTENAKRETREANRVLIGLSAIKVFQGAAIAQNATGYAAKVATTALKFRGFANDQVDNSAGSPGDLNLLINIPDVVRVKHSGLTIADEGKEAFWLYDNQVQTTGNGCFAGLLFRYIDATWFWLDCRPAYARAINTFRLGTFAIGANANAIGSGLALGDTKTAAHRVYGDDGGVAITGDVRTCVSRFLITIDQSAGGGSASGHKGQVVIGADAKSPNATVGGFVGTIEGKGTSGHTAEADGWVNAGLVGIVDMPTYSDGGSGKVVSAFGAAGVSLAGMTAARLGVIHVPAPIAGSWGNFAVFATATAYECGAKAASITGLPTDGTADGLVKIQIGTTAYYIPFVTAGHVTGE